MGITKTSKKQVDQLADILSHGGLVSLASVVIPAMFDNYSPFRILLGILAALICWLISLRLKR